MSQVEHVVESFTVGWRFDGQPFDPTKCISGIHFPKTLDAAPGARGVPLLETLRESAGSSRPARLETIDAETAAEYARSITAQSVFGTASTTFQSLRAAERPTSGTAGKSRDLDDFVQRIAPGAQRPVQLTEAQEFARSISR